MSAANEVSHTRSTPRAFIAAAIRPVLDLARLHAEHLAERNADGRGDLDDDLLLRILQIPPEILGIVLRKNCSGRTDRSTQPAPHAFSGGQVLIHGRSNARLATATEEVDRTDSLDFPAGTNAIAAKDAFLRIANDGRTALVERRFLEQLLVADLVDAESPRQSLKLAGCALSASRTALFVACQQEFQRHFSHPADRFGVRPDDHTRFRRRRATGHDAEPFDIHQAEAACTVDAQFTVVAEGRNIDPGLPRHFENVAFSLDGDLFAVDGDCVRFHGSILPLKERSCIRVLNPWVQPAACRRR